jgi:hypothetical protein
MWYLLKTGQTISQAPRAFDRMDICLVYKCLINPSINQASFTCNNVMWCVQATAAAGLDGRPADARHQRHPLHLHHRPLYSLVMTSARNMTSPLLVALPTFLRLSVIWTNCLNTSGRLILICLQKSTFLVYYAYVYYYFTQLVLWTR